MEKKKLKVLNLYAGIGGNRKLWENVDVTAVEINPDIAAIYQVFFPNDKVIVGDAHKFLEKHINDDWDFIWSSPPCPSHSRIRKQIGVEVQKNCKPIYPDMKLYEEILFLEGYCKCKFIVENVISWYPPLKKPSELSRHYFWGNFTLPKKKFETLFTIRQEGNQGKQDKLGFNLSNYKGINKTKILRNCVNPKVALYIFNCAFHRKQLNIFDY